MNDTIRAILEELVEGGATSSYDVDLVDQTRLAAEGYMLSRLDADLTRLASL